MSKSLLSSPASALERAIESALAPEEPPPINTLWSPHDCPLAFLPWLAYACGVEEWDSAWPEATQRSTVASAMEIARHRGTVWAVREALRAAGYADAELQEGLPVLTYDGSQLHDAVETYAGGARWALFKVIADIGEDKGVGGAELSRLLRLIDRAKNVRSVLREVAYRATVSDVLELEEAHDVNVLHTVEEVRPWGRRYDGSIQHDQATILPRQPQYFDGSYRHTAELRYDGLQPYHDWDVTGERYDNRWDALDFSLTASIAESTQIVAGYDGAAAYESALTYGGEQRSAVDAGELTITLRRRHNGRLTYNGAQRHAGSAPTQHAF